MNRVAPDSSGPAVYAIATMDTKGEEILYVAERIRTAGVDVRVVNAGTRATAEIGADIGYEALAAFHPAGKDAVLGQTDRAQSIAAMSDALTAFLAQQYEAGRLSAAIGIGGGGGTSLIARAMRALPIGVPKLMVSTLAGGNVAPFVDCSDITMMPAVVDLAGINRISMQVLGNAAHAIAGMARQTNHHDRTAQRDLAKKPTVAMTMFGVTTPCVDAVRKALEAQGCECPIFHATGVGGRTMEKLVESGFVDAVLDITLTEIADEVVGGILPAGPERFDRIIARRIPYVMSLGALDMVNFGPPETVPAQFRQRRLHVHNSAFTLMRTSVEENQLIAHWIAAKVNQATAPLVILIPERGVSALDAPGQPFHDPDANAALFEELEKAVHQDGLRRIQRLDLHINDPAFSQAIVEHYCSLDRSLDSFKRRANVGA